MSKTVRTSIGLLAVLFLTVAADFPADAEGSAGEVEWKLSGEARFRPEWRDDRDLDSDLDDDTRQAFMRLRLGAEATYKDNYRVFVQAQDSRIAGQETSTIANERNLDIHQGYLEIRRLGTDRLSLTLGRQEWAYGEERLVGSLGWDNVGRSFDGARLRYATERSSLDGLMSRVSESAPAGPTRGSDLYGVQWLIKPGTETEYGAYWIGFSNSVLAAGETGVPGDTTIDTFGGRIRSVWGAVVFNAETAVQRGEVNGDDLSAFAGAAMVAYRLGTETRVRPFAGYDFATGDEDPADGEREEFVNLFPTNHGHYGYADLEGWRNIRSPYVGATIGRGRHTATLKTHWFELDEAAGAWKDAAGSVLGQDPTGGSGRGVGTEHDFVYTLKVDEKVSLMAGVSRFDPGSFARSVRGEDPSTWAFVMLTAGI